MYLFIISLLQIISRKCGCGIQDEPPQTEEDHADAFTTFVKPYSPNDNKNTNTAKVNDTDANDTLTTNDAEPINSDTMPMNDSMAIESDDTIKMDVEQNICEIDVSIQSMNINSDLVELNDKLVKDLKIDNTKEIDDKNNDSVSPKIDEIISQNNETGEIELNSSIKDEKILENDIKIDATKKKSQKDKEKSTKDKEKSSKDKEKSSQVYCNKCFNTKLNGVCLCTNVNLYHQLVAKSNVGRGDYKKGLSDESFASVDLSTAIALINR